MSEPVPERPLHTATEPPVVGATNLTTDPVFAEVTDPDEVADVAERVRGYWGETAD